MQSPKNLMRLFKNLNVLKSQLTPNQKIITKPDLFSIKLKSKIVF